MNALRERSSIHGAARDRRKATRGKGRKAGERPELVAKMEDFAGKYKPRTPVAGRHGHAARPFARGDRSRGRRHSRTRSSSRPKIMGAGIAAGPHCPFALDPAETVSPATGGFEGRRPGRSSEEPSPERPSQGPASSGVHPRPKPLPVSPRAPRQGRSPGGSPLAVSKPKLLFLLWRAPPAEAFGSASGRIQSRSPGSAWQVHGPKPWVIAGFAAPEPKPGPARPCRSRSFSRAGGSARTEVPPSAGLVLDPKVRCPACPVPPVRRPLVPMGASRSMPLSHKLKGKPAASAWRRLRQPPCLPLRSTIRPKADGRSRPGLWLGRLSSVAGRSSRPHPRNVTIVPAFQEESTCG
jgi:hypothetical protein